MKPGTAVRSSEKWNGKEAWGGFDLLRVILAYIVILRHFIAYLLPSESGYGVLICETVSTAAVPTYWIMSGYFFFLKPFSMRRLKRQLLRLLRLYTAWKVIGIPFVLLINVRNHVSLWEGVPAYLRDFLFPASHLWYLPALMFALAFVSWIRMLKKPYALLLATGLFMAGLLLDTYRFLIPQLSEWSATHSVLLNARSGLFFGTFYVYLGYVFAQSGFKISRLQAASGVAVSLLLLCAEGILLFRYQGVRATDIMIGALPVAAFTFLFAQRQKVGLKQDKLIRIRKFSVALYCVHPFFLLMCLWIDRYIPAIPKACIWMLNVLSSTMASFIIVKLSEKHRLIAYLV